MSTVRRTLLLAALVVTAGGLAFATGATVLDGDADTVADGDLAIQPADGPNGDYAYLNDDDEIVIDVSASNPNLGPDFEGVNPGSLASAEGVFEITYTADQYAHVWIEHEGENVTFVADGEPIEGEENNVTLAPNETVAIGLDVDARDAVAGTSLGSDEFDVRAELAEPESVQSTSADDESDGATTKVWSPDSDSREFEGQDLPADGRTTFDADGMRIDGENVTLDRVRIESAVDGDVAFETQGQPDPFDSAGPLADDRGAAGAGYFAFDHSFTTEEVSAVRFGISIDRDHLNETGTDPEDVSLYRRSETEPDGWERLETEPVDPEVRRLLDLPEDRVHLTATTENFSVFAVGTERPVVRATNASLDPEAVDPGETAVVRASVANEGGADGEQSVALTADGETVATERVDLDPDETDTVEFETAFDEPGAYELAVENESAGTLVVGDPAGDGDDADSAGGTDADSGASDGGGDDAPTEEPGAIDPANLAGLFALLLIVLVSGALVRRMPKP
ncbi:MAG: CARDB domain-containing protein [Haloferacaceae archaeon]